MFSAGLSGMAESSKKVIGGFRILQEIQAGSGAQGTVYKAVCEDDSKGIAAKGTVVALKVMAVQDEDKSQWRKLEKRTRELSELKHPNVVRYYGASLIRERTYSGRSCGSRYFSLRSSSSAS